MASIKKRGDSWRVQVKHLGKRVTKSFKLKASAIAWAHEQEGLLHTKTMVDGKHSVREALERYRDEESYKKTGARWEIIRINKFLRTLPFVDKALQDLTVDDITRWRNKQTNKGSTVRREMVLLDSILGTARKEWGWLLVNPMDDVAKPSDGRPRSRLITDEEIEKMCEALSFVDGEPVVLKTQEVAVAFLLAIETAMRSGELMSLTPDQVDLKKRVAHLDKTKNGDERDVPLSYRAVELFRMVPNCFSLTDASRDTLFRKARTKAGLSGFTFHDARALALTRLAKKVDVLTLARIAGHRNIKSLMVYYRESAEDIAKRLG